MNQISVPIWPNLSFILIEQKHIKLNYMGLECKAICILIDLKVWNDGAFKLKYIKGDTNLLKIRFLKINLPVYLLTLVYVLVLDVISTWEREYHLPYKYSITGCFSHSVRSFSLSLLTQSSSYDTLDDFFPWCQF